jgi:hypothetical protein
MITNGQRVGGFILIEDSSSGIRYAVRPHSVGVVIDADPCRDATHVCIGVRTIRVEAAMDEVLAWLSPTRA